MKVSMCEIYNEKIRDLFDTKKNNLSIHQDRKGAIFIKNITEQWCSSEEQLLNFMKKGNKSRTVAKTGMNDTSSRSHSIFMLTLYIDNKEDGTCKVGKLFLVDLAGSEKVSKTGATGQTLEEGKSINLSLTVLGRVINALTDPNQFSIPYRESTLTRLLSDSLGGNSKTCLIITCSPHPSNDQETISTMRFGERARIVKNKAKVNREFSVEELKQILAKANTKIEMQEKRIKALQAKINAMGGKISEQELEKLAKNLPNDEEEVKVSKDGIDLGDSNLLDDDLNLPDTPFDAMAKRKATMIARGVQDSNIVSLEEFQAVEDSVKQLQEEM